MRGIDLLSPSVSPPLGTGRTDRWRSPTGGGHRPVAVTVRGRGGPNDHHRWRLRCPPGPHQPWPLDAPDQRARDEVDGCRPTRVCRLYRSLDRFVDGTRSQACPADPRRRRPPTAAAPPDVPRALSGWTTRRPAGCRPRPNPAEWTHGEPAQAGGSGAGRRRAGGHARREPRRFLPRLRVRHKPDESARAPVGGLLEPGPELRLRCRYPRIHCVGCTDGIRVAAGQPWGDRLTRLKP